MSQLIFDTTDFFVSTPHEDAPDWMNDYFAEIARNLQRVLTTTEIETVFSEPFRKYDGLMVFADGTEFDPGDGRGVYYWDSLSGTAGEWKLIKSSLSGSILTGESNAIQDPAGLDNPLQVEFGVAQTTDDMDLDVNGVLTIKTPGTYVTAITLYYSRATSPGSAFFFMRLLKDGIQQGNPLGIEQSDDDITTPLFLNTATRLQENELPATFTIECVRDGQGKDSGGLRPLVSTIGWGSTPSARVRIFKL